MSTFRSGFLDVSILTYDIGSIPSGGYGNNEEAGDVNQHDESSHKIPRLAERRALLDADPYVLKFQRDEVTCRNCNKTVKLSSQQDSKLSDWHNHRSSCSGGLYVMTIFLPELI